MKPIYLAALLPAFISACAETSANYTPILDGPQTVGFQSDLSACQSLARAQNQIDRETANAVALGAGAGALLGAADDDGDAAVGTIVGALAGGVAGTVNATEQREAIVVECLRGRGHRVVG